MHNIYKHKIIATISTLLIATLIYSLPENDIFNKKILTTLAIASVIFIFWITEIIPIAITSLLPLILLPLFHIMDINAVAQNYGNKIIFLFLSGFILAIAINKWGLNKRIALNIIKITGSSPKGILLGFMLATAFISMWISNTATTIMMLPIAISIINIISNNKNKEINKFAKILLLSIAYSASIGGIATIIGTPPNAILIAYLDESLNYDFLFKEWFILFFPLSIILLIAIWIYFSFFKLKNIHIKTSKEGKFINDELKKIGKINYEEKAVTIIFILIAAGWMLKSFLPFEISDISIGLIGSILLFITPSKQEGEFLLDWNDCKDISWGTLLLFGGGLSIAASLEQSGFIDVIGNYITIISVESLMITLITTIIITMVFTEFISNLALTTILIPVLAVISLKISGSPLTLTLPATIAASTAFILPMSTPPNAVIFSSGYLKVSDIIKSGVFANIISLIIIVIYAKLFII
jgi:sodium-dependent dicarboxylate transporter 2/3/5